MPSSMAAARELIAIGASSGDAVGDDDGPGIPPPQRERVEPFYRLAMGVTVAPDLASISSRRSSGGMVARS